MSPPWSALKGNQISNLLQATLVSSLMWSAFWQKCFQGLCCEMSGPNCGLKHCCARGGCLSNSQTDSGRPPKAREGRRDTERAGVAWKVSAPAFSCSIHRSKSSARDTLWLSQWGGELERERQTENGREEIHKQKGRFGGGYLGRENKKWMGHMGGFQWGCFISFGFLSDRAIIAEKSMT